MNAIVNVSRREFVKAVFSTGALVLSASLVPDILRAQTSAPGAISNNGVLRPNVFVAIESDDTLVIRVKPDNVKIQVARSAVSSSAKEPPSDVRTKAEFGLTR